MKRHSLLLAGMALLASSSLAFAQVPADPAAPAAPAAGAPASPMTPAVPAVEGDNPFTVANIDPLKPFGDIAVETGANADSLAAFIDQLSDEQLTELDQRCNVIAGTGTEFPEDVKAFCGTWAIARAEEEGNAALAPGLVPNPGGALGITQSPAPGGAAAPAAPAAPAP